MQVLTTIDNVGGNGFNSQTSIASEATLAALLQAVKGGGSGLNNSQEASNTNASGGAVNALKGTAKALTAPLAGAVKGVGRLAKELAYGNARLGDFAEAIFDGSNAMVDLTRYLDSNIDNLRELSSAGASFNNSLVDMLDASVKSGMRLGQFQQFVSNSTESLAAFGGTVTSGAKSFGKFSKDFRDGPGRRLFEMGLTVNDINDSLLSYAEIERRRTGENIRNDAVTRQNALAYSKTVEGLTKVTGLQRDQIEDSLQKQVQEARVRNMQSRLSTEALANFQSNLGFVDEKLGGAFADGFRDIVDGVAQTDAGKALANQLGPSFVDFAQRAGRGEVSQDEFLKRIASAGKTLNAKSKTFGDAQLSAMESAGGINTAIANLFNEAYKLADAQALDAKKASDEGDARDKITATLNTFDESITALRTQAIDAITTTLTQDEGLIDSFSKLGDTASDKFSPAIENISTQLSNMMTDFGDLSLSMIGPDGGAVSVIDKLTAALDNLPDNLTNIFGDGGLLGKAITNIGTEFDGLGTAIASAISYQIKDAFGGFAGTSAGEDETRRLVEKFEKNDEPLTREETQTLVQTLTQKKMDEQGGATSFFYDLFKGMGTGALYDLINADSLKSRETIQSLINTTRNVGTLKATGKTTEPADITAKLHKGERVLNPQEAAAYNSQTSDSTIQSAIDGLRERVQELLPKISNFSDSAIQSAIDKIQEREATATAYNSQTIDSAIQSAIDKIQEREATAYNSQTSDSAIQSAIDGLREQGEATAYNSQTSDSAIQSAINGLRERVQELLPKITNSIDSAIQSAINGIQEQKLLPEISNSIDSAIQSAIDKIQEAAAYTSQTSDSAIQSAIDGIQEREQKLLPKIPKIGKVKTTEPADVSANIRKGERVLNPQNASYKSQNQEAAAYNSQTGAGGTIQQLNTTMNQAVSLLQTIATYQGQTAKSVAGIGTDYYRGINT